MHTDSLKQTERKKKSNRAKLFYPCLGLKEPHTGLSDLDIGKNMTNLVRSQRINQPNTDEIQTLPLLPPLNQH